MASVELDSLEIDWDGQGRTELEHSPEVIAALQSAAQGVKARAEALSVSGEAAYHCGVDVLPTTAKGYVVTANIQARAANNRAGMNPLKVAIGG